MTSEFFWKLPLEERVRLIMEEKVEFIREGKVIPVTEALRKTRPADEAGSALG